MRAAARSAPLGKKGIRAQACETAFLSDFYYSSSFGSQIASLRIASLAEFYYSGLLGEARPAWADF
jgi:hypothetical protein